MKPVKFAECNTIYAEHQEEYQPLPACRFRDGSLVTCWHLSLAERLRLLFSGKLWLNVLTFNQPLQPLFMTTEKKEVILTPADKLEEAK